ncbi:MAG TPA: winged helix-turn-helix domain-containing protein [Pyrinomonadaceae bacterium]|jgi:DNA-binding winged helix-turn-helix (wHTH) protein/TolB-like protein
MSQNNGRVYEFGAFRLHATRRVLTRDGAAVPLTSKAFDTLLLLVERGGEVVPKSEMMDALWPDTAVEENNLTQHVSMLRKALGERAGAHRYVVTIPGRGYSFVADVREVAEAAADSGLDGRAGAEAPAVEVPAVVAAAATPRGGPGGAARLRVVAAVVAAAAVLAAGLYVWRARAADERERSGELSAKSIAVLPFRTLGAGADDMTGAGMADALTTRLAGLGRVSVRPTSAVLRQTGDTSQAGRALGVDAVVEGTVQRIEGRARVTVQLVRVSDGEPLWAESFNESYTDIFALQDAVSERVARALAARLGGVEPARPRRRATESAAAYEEYLRGRHFWNKRNEEGLRKSIEHFQRAADLDPAYGAAYAGLADAYAVLSGYGFGTLPPDECMRRARASALKAIEIDDTLAEAHASLAMVKAYHEFDHAGAEVLFRRAVELNPSYATAHHWYSDFLAEAGRPAEALAEAERAAELDPLSPIIKTTLAERFYFTREHGRAAEQLRLALELAPDFIQAHSLLGLVYAQQGRHGESVAELERAFELTEGKSLRVASALGYAYAVAGRKAEARRMLGLLTGGGKAPQDVALLLLSLGERDEARRWLERTREKIGSRPALAVLLRTDPMYESLRADTEFRSLFEVTA